MKICKIEGCTSKVDARGWCSKHYQRWKAHGDPNKILKPQYDSPEERWDAWTEWQGDCLVWVGAKDAYGYGQIWVSGKLLGAHRYAWERENGPIPEGKVIDHKDHCDTRCCNVKHLRLATKAENNSNLSGKRVNNVSGLRNISWSKAANKWQVTIKNKYFGVFDSVEEAKPIRDRIRKELYGEFAGTG